jgi:MFS family permease
MTSESGQTTAGTTPIVGLVSDRYFYGWNVVAATFVVGLFAFGLGFYGVTVYLAALQTLHGWSAATVSAPVTVYYVAGALLSAGMAGAYARVGPRVVVLLGTIAMAVGITALGLVTAPWQLYPAFLVMALGWGSMSGAALNILVAPWFERRRGLAVSVAFNGATLGGVLVAPALIPLIGALGFRRAVAVAATVMAAVLLPIALLVLRRGPESLGLAPDGDAPRLQETRACATNGGRLEALRTWRFWSVSIPFALGLAAQVGLLTHVVALLTPPLGLAGAARAVSVTTLAALIGRLVTGGVVDRVDRRRVASLTLLVQLAGVGLLARGDAPWTLYGGCVLFGLGVGNLTSLPGLIVAVEWPRERFASLVGLVVAINQLTFAFGPTMVGVARDWSGGYGAALALCMLLQACAAGLVLLGPGRR